MKRNRRGQTVDEYVASKIAVADTGCWIWGNTKPGRYGWFEFCGHRNDGAHIEVYRRRKGPIPKGKILRHTCDDTRCVNLDHLLIGTKKDNRRDFMERHPRARELCLEAAKIGVNGVKKFWASMTPEQKKEFCERRAARQSELYPPGHPVRLDAVKKAIAARKVIGYDEGTRKARETKLLNGTYLIAAKKTRIKRLRNNSYVIGAHKGWETKRRMGI